jgi:hypothetical protein
MFYAKAVQYTENGKLFDAIVFHEHSRLESHLGANDEPLVHIVFADPAKEHLNLADPMQKMIVRFDVAHASHEFSDEELAAYEKRGFDAAKELGAGRWHESRDPREVMKELALAAEERKKEKSKQASQDAPKTKKDADPDGRQKEAGDENKERVN